MKKRMWSSLLICFVLIAGLLVPDLQAATIKAPYMTEQAIGKAPKITAYVTGSEMNTKATVTGKVNQEKLKQTGKIKKFKDSKKSISYVVLIDNSGSVNANQLSKVKERLVKLRKNLKNKDKLEIYTVGTTSSTKDKSNLLGRTAKASEKDKVDADCKKINELPRLGNDSNTILYRSLNDVLEKNVSPSIRTVILLITDGEDASKGKDNDAESTLENVKEAKVPVYGILLNNTLASPNKEKINFTKSKLLAEKNCRGYYYDCSTSGDTGSVDNAFDTLEKLWQEQTYVVNLEASSNQTSGISDLKLTINKEASNTISFDYSDYQSDGDAPVIEEEIVSESPDTITFTITDENGVDDNKAKDITNYTLTSVKGEKEKKTWTITTAGVEKEKKGVRVTLTVSENLYKGDYKLVCKGITDKSQDSNAMNQTVNFTLEEGASAFVAGLKNFLKAYWWILLLLLILVLGLIIVVVLKKRAAAKVEIDPEELSKSDTRMITLSITDKTGYTQDISWNVEGSLFIGRSEICNIYFDDDKLSRQHFVLDVNRMGCFIQDLNSKNGTFVNGVRVPERRQLIDGDTIVAGREKFVIHIAKIQNYHDPEKPDYL